MNPLPCNSLSEKASRAFSVSSPPELSLGLGIWRSISAIFLVCHHAAFQGIDHHGRLEILRGAGTFQESADLFLAQGDELLVAHAFQFFRGDLGFRFFLLFHFGQGPEIHAEGGQAQMIVGPQFKRAVPGIRTFPGGRRPACFFSGTPCIFRQVPCNNSSHRADGFTTAPSPRKLATMDSLSSNPGRRQVAGDLHDLFHGIGLVWYPRSKRRRSAWGS